MSVGKLPEMNAYFLFATPKRRVSVSKCLLLRSGHAFKNAMHLPSMEIPSFT